MLSVSNVSITADLSVAKVYLSIFLLVIAKEILEGIRANKNVLKHDLAQQLRSDLRKVPNLLFFLDDSLEYIDAIEHSLTRKNDPLKE